MLHGEEAGGAWINWPSIDPVAMTTPNSIGSDEWESLAVRTLMIRPVHGRQDLEHKRHILADGWAVFSRKHRLLSALQLCATMKNRWDTEPISRLTGNSGHAKQNFKHFIRRKKRPWHGHLFLVSTNYSLREVPGVDWGHGQCLTLTLNAKLITGISTLARVEGPSLFQRSNFHWIEIQFRSTSWLYSN